MVSELRHRFYVLGPSRGSSADTEVFKVEPIVRGDAPQCATCGRFLGMRPWLAPRSAQMVVHGDRAGDFAFGSSSEFLVSEAVEQAVERSGLTGLRDFDEVEITATLRMHSAGPHRYFHVETIGQGATLDVRQSAIERTAEPDCDDCLSDGIAAIRGFALDQTSWSGANAFVVRGLPGLVVVSEAFEEIATKHELSNLELVPTETFTWDPAATG